MKILRNKKILILLITAIALLTLTLGVSYAYFTATVTGNDSAVVTKIVAGILDVDFTITDRISNDNILLIKDEKREEKAETLDFTVSNNGRGTLDAVYYVYLTDVNITNNLKSSDFKWELIKNNETVFTGNFSSAETNTDFTITSETNNGIVIPVKQELSVGQVDRYKLRIWLSETEGDQNSLLNGSFSGKVRVTSTQLTGSEKYVVFKDQSGTQLGKKIISDGKTNYTMDISSVNLTGSTNIYCNNGGIPTISNNTLSIDGVTNNVECKISNDIVDTITNQLTTSKTGIVMTNNQNDITSLIIRNKEVVFDLNGKTLNGIAVNTDSEVWNNDHCGFSLYSATLTVNDSVGTGGLYTGKDGRALRVEENNRLIINNGNFSGRQAIYVSSSSNMSTVDINGGNFTSNIYEVVGMNSTNSVININGGTFTGTTSQTIHVDKGTVNISNGRFIGGTGTTINTSGVLNITGGYIVNNSVNSLSCSESATININASNAQFDSNGNYVSGLYVEAHGPTPAFIPQGTVSLTGGTFKQICEPSESCNTAIYHYRGNMSIYDCEAYSDSVNVVNSVADNLYIYGGNFYGSFRTGSYLGYSGSQNYICGGTFTSTGTNISSNNADSIVKYKSSVVWTGKTTPTINGPNPEVVSLDDTIVCP